jgi:GTPase SAR1 family protein
LDVVSKELNQLLVSKGSDPSPHYVGVWGMGGVGKTLLLKKPMISWKFNDTFKALLSFGLWWGKIPIINQFTKPCLRN